MALTSLITTAVHDENPKHDLPAIREAITKAECASSLVSFHWSRNLRTAALTDPLID